MALQPLHFEIDDHGPTSGVGLVLLEQPGKPVIVLDRELIERLELTLRDIPPNLKGLVLASASDRAFVAGADLKSILDLDDAGLFEYLRFGSHVFAMLSKFPFPTAAAINGAALGGGLELAMHCDALIAAPPPLRDGQPGRPYPVGLPEAGLGICPGWGGTSLLAARLDPITAIEATAFGTPLMFEQAVHAGLFDVVAPDASQLRAAAKTWVASAHCPPRDGSPSRHAGRPEWSSKVAAALSSERLGAGLNSGASRAVATAVSAGVDRGFAGCLEVEQKSLVHLRNTPTARDLIAAFFAKSKK